jgi:hypothetical protein
MYNRRFTKGIRAMDGESEQRNWLPVNFFRTPAWRWRRAEYLTSSRHRLNQSIDDDWVARARAVCKAANSRVVSRHRRNDAIAVALDLWRNPSVRRSTLEAFLLTSCSFEQVAERCATPLPLVESYHAVFFDVRSRLLAKDWIISRAVGSSPSPDSAKADLARIWKFVAVSGGANLLDVVIAVTTASPLPAWLTSSFKNPAIDESRFRLEIKLSMCELTACTPRERKSLSVLRRRLRRSGVGDVSVEDVSGNRMFSVMEAFSSTCANQHREDALPPRVEVSESKQTFISEPTGLSIETPEPKLIIQRSYYVEDPDPIERSYIEREQQRCRVYVTTC